MSVPDLTDSDICALRCPPAELAFLTGSGISLTAGLPSWTTFVINLLASVGVKRDDATRYVRAVGNLQVAADGARARAQQEALSWRRVVAQALHPIEPSSTITSPTQVHRVVAQAAADHGCPVLTTNFDLLHETAMEELNRFAYVEPYDQAADKSLAAGVIGAVHHLHGFADPTLFPTVGEPEPWEVSAEDLLVVSQTDYNRVLTTPPTTSWQHQLIGQVLQEEGRRFLVVGHSMSDHDVQAWFHPHSGDKGHVVIAREGLHGLGADELRGTHPFRGLLEEQWRALGFAPVFTEHFADVGGLIAEHLHKAGQPAGYRPPSQRCGAVKKAVEDRIRQRSEELADIIDSVSRPPELRGTETSTAVWLADGDHRIHRVAAADRVLRRLDDHKARSTDVGTDSVAAAALQAEQTIRREGHGRWPVIYGRPIKLAIWDHPAIPCAGVTLALQDKTPLTDPDLHLEILDYCRKLDAKATPYLQDLCSLL